MLEIQQQKENSTEQYLHSGEQTVITPDILQIAQSFEGADEEKISQIIQFLRGLRYESENKNELFRRRTSSQIISDGFVTGCTDDALVFISLARAVGIPAKYIETLDTSWLEHGGRPIKGHVYAGVCLDNVWKVVDPSARNENADIEKDGRVIIAEGLDSWDIGAIDFDTLAQMSEGFMNKNFV